MPSLGLLALSGAGLDLDNALSGLHKQPSVKRDEGFLQDGKIPPNDSVKNRPLAVLLRQQLIPHQGV